ncbi:MAG: hypothetical protein LQ351_004831 [Letrouitia transgressa]|nr:MAG: hypothetical protein LQ351_004831 [Letrouitia transgressa]
MTNASEVDGDGFEDEDGLGYYPDGVKRTLADDQIAMFRRSEINALLRKRQLQREKEKADADDPQSNLEISNEGQEKRDSRAPTARRLARELDEVVTDSGDLDYGEDAATKLNTRNQPGENIYGRKQVSYDDIDDDPTLSKCSVPSKSMEGKKIWWPMIGPQTSPT